MRTSGQSQILCALLTLALLMTSVPSTTVAQDAWVLDAEDEFRAAQAEADAVRVRSAPPVGGGFDLPGDGALMLARTDTTRPFWASSEFQAGGSWVSRWHDAPATRPVQSVGLDWITYGQEVRIDDWTKFEGNPLVAEHGWTHNIEETLVLPEAPAGQPQDQSIVRGVGPWKGQWMLIFNIDSRAASGLGLAVADSLAPIREGRNPFRLNARRHPIADPEGDHGPNDWLARADSLYAPDLMIDAPSYIWRTSDFTDLSARTLEDFRENDAGLTDTDDQIHMFIENSPYISHCRLTGSRCEDVRHVLRVGGHTGDPDVSYFNNRWHMFVDTHPHGEYRIGYASTSGEAFPEGWTLHTKEMLGPYTPDQGHLWDDPTSEGNEFGTGDFDAALEGTTLYGTWERPVGIAYNELDELYDGSDQTVQVQLQVDTNGDDRPEAGTAWRTFGTGTARWTDGAGLDGLPAGRIRVRIRLLSRRATESPLVRSLRVAF